MNVGLVNEGKSKKISLNYYNVKSIYVKLKKAKIEHFKEVEIKNKS